MLRKALGWAAAIIIGMWVYKNPGGAADFVHHIVGMFSAFVNRM